MYRNYLVCFAQMSEEVYFEAVREMSFAEFAQNEHFNLNWWIFCKSLSAQSGAHREM